MDFEFCNKEGGREVLCKYNGGSLQSRCFSTSLPVTSSKDQVCPNTEYNLMFGLCSLLSGTLFIIPGKLGLFVLLWSSTLPIKNDNYGCAQAMPNHL